MTKEYILDQLDTYCEFSEELCEGTWYDMIVYPLENAGCFTDWTYDAGVSKGVLIFDKLDFVIKIPFYCEYYEEDGYYDSHSEYVVECEGGPSGYAFSGEEVEGYVHHNHWDYCETEELRYLEAEKNGMSEHFARTWFIGKVHGWPIYAQDRACMYRSESSRSARSQKEYSKEDLDTVRKISSKTYFGVDDEWMMDFLHYWNKDVLENFAKYCSEKGISDLHRGNIGYICGVPCLVDYSSFSG